MEGRPREKGEERLSERADTSLCLRPLMSLFVPQWRWRRQLPWHKAHAGSVEEAH